MEFKKLLIAICFIALSSVNSQGLNFPTYSLDRMPSTTFTCRDKILGGYYADAETQCQMFHVCVKVAGVGVQDFRFLCPNGTAFDQEAQTCADWGDVDCEAATLYYASDNFDLYRIGAGFESKRAPYAEEDEATFHLQRAETGDSRRSKHIVVNQSTKPQTPPSYKTTNNFQNYNQYETYDKITTKFQKTRPPATLTTPTTTTTTTTTPAPTTTTTTSAPRTSPTTPRPPSTDAQHFSPRKEYNPYQIYNSIQTTRLNAQTTTTTIPFQQNRLFYQTSTGLEGRSNVQSQTPQPLQQSSTDEIFRGSHSSNFFNNRNNGKEDYENDYQEKRIISAKTTQKPNRARNQQRGRVTYNSSLGKSNANNITPFPAKPYVAPVSTTTTTTVRPAPSSFVRQQSTQNNYESSRNTPQGPQIVQKSRDFTQENIAPVTYRPSTAYNLQQKTTQTSSTTHSPIREVTKYDSSLATQSQDFSKLNTYSQPPSRETSKYSPSSQQTEEFSKLTTFSQYTPIREVTKSVPVSSSVSQDFSKATTFSQPISTGSKSDDYSTLTAYNKLSSPVSQTSQDYSRGTTYSQPISTTRGDTRSSYQTNQDFSKQTTFSQPISSTRDVTRPSSVASSQTSQDFSKLTTQSQPITPEREIIKVSLTQKQSKPSTYSQPSSPEEEFYDVPKKVKKIKTAVNQDYGTSVTKTINGPGVLTLTSSLGTSENSDKFNPNTNYDLTSVQQSKFTYNPFGTPKVSPAYDSTTAIPSSSFRTTTTTTTPAPSSIYNTQPPHQASSPRGFSIPITLDPNRGTQINLANTPQPQFPKRSETTKNYTPSTVKKFSTLVPRELYDPTTFKPATFKKPIDPLVAIKAAQLEQNKLSTINDKYTAASYLPTSTSSSIYTVPVSSQSPPIAPRLVPTTQKPLPVGEIDENDGQYHPELYEKDFARYKIKNKKQQKDFSTTFQATSSPYTQTTNVQKSTTQFQKPQQQQISAEEEFLKTAHSQNIVASGNQLRQDQYKKQQAAFVEKQSSPRPFSKAAPTIPPHATSTKRPKNFNGNNDKDASYDYQYYDSLNDNTKDYYQEYDLLEDFGKTTKRTKPLRQ